MQQTTDQCFEQSYLSNLPIEGNTLDYGQFLELCITKQPSGLGLHFKMGEADKIFNNMDKNKTGKIRLDDWISHFSCRQENSEVMPAKKRIALVAHDNFKVKMVEWCSKWKDVLVKHLLVGTGTTGKKVTEETGLHVEVLQSGPFGGDQQIGAKISEQTIDILIFFWDPLASMAHDQDVKALFRIASLYNVIMAPNISTADMIISNTLVEMELPVQRPNMQKYIKRTI